jgi:hypothetical protein
MNIHFLDLKAINARHAAELAGFELEFTAWAASLYCIGKSFA